MDAKIDEYITKEKCKKILKDLVKINTTNLPGNEMELVYKILDYFPKDIIHYDILEHGDNRGSLIITLPGIIEKQSLAFIGHIDTVPVTDEIEWSHPPFGAVVTEDLLYGRGSADMKGGVTSMILTALYLIDNGITPPLTLKFCFTADEESNGIGVCAIRDEGFLNDIAGLIIPEPTNEQIGLGEKGALWLSVKVDGKAAHASQPDNGSNAIAHLILYIEKLRKLVDTTEKEILLGQSSFQITTFKGGVKTNIIPNSAEATIDIRTISGVNHENIVNEGLRIAEEMKAEEYDLDIELKVENNRPPISINEKHPFIKEWKTLFEKYSFNTTTKGIKFYTDASQVIPHIDVPFVILGPGEEAMAHQMNEKISLSAVEKITKIYIQYILNKLESTEE